MLASWHSRGAQQPDSIVRPILVGSRTFTDDGTTSTFTVPLTTLTGGTASAPRTGDLVVAYIAGSSLTDGAIPMPSGWNELSQLSANDTIDSNLYVIYKTMGATPDTGFDIPGGLASVDNSIAVAIFVYSGAAVATPVFTTATGINTVLCDPPAITPTVEGSIILSGGGGAHNQNGTYSSSDFDAFLSVVANGQWRATIGVGRFAWTSGAFDPAQFTFSAANTSVFSWTALSLVIIPE